MPGPVPRHHARPPAATGLVSKHPGDAARMRPDPGYRVYLA